MRHLPRVLDTVVHRPSGAIALCVAVRESGKAVIGRTRSCLVYWRSIDCIVTRPHPSDRHPPGRAAQ